MKLLISLILLGTYGLFAKEYEYKVYADEEKSIDWLTDLRLTIDLDGEFKKGSKVKRIYIEKILRDSSRVVVFDWKEKDLAEFFIIKWNNDNTISLKSSYSDEIFKSPVTKKYYNGWGDTDFSPEYDYFFHAEGALRISEKGSEVNPGEYAAYLFEIGNSTYDEMCMWGILGR